jgi:uncharacterized membrane protein
MTRTSENLLCFFIGMMTGAGLVVLIMVIEYLHRVGALLP